MKLYPLPQVVIGPLLWELSIKACAMEKKTHIHGQYFLLDQKEKNDKINLQGK